MSISENAKVLSETDTDIAQYLTFNLAGDIYGVDILKVKEIFEYEELTAVPMVPNFIRGVLNLRGQVVPVIDLVARFGGEPAVVGKKTCIVILEVEVEHSEEDAYLETIDIGIVVDQVNQVVELPVKDIEPPPAFGAKIRTDFILGMGKVESGFIVLLDITKVLSVQELTVLDAIGKDEQQYDGEC